jgi:hypothetical protein
MILNKKRKTKEIANYITISKVNRLNKNEKKKTITYNNFEQIQNKHLFIHAQHTLIVK